jgi:acyl carrier protein
MVSEKLKGVILREFGLEELDIDDSTTAAMVPGWDSLKHVQLVMAVEEAFGVRFRALEVIRLRNVGELQALIDRKLA